MPGSRLFIISGDPATRRILADMVRTEDAGEPCVFESIVAFIEQYDPRWCGCIVIDMRLPAHDGLKLQWQQARVLCRMSLIHVMVIDDALVAFDPAIGDFSVRHVTADDARAELGARIRRALREHDDYCVRVAERARLHALYDSTSQREREVLERLARAAPPSRSRPTSP